MKHKAYPYERRSAPHLYISRPALVGLGALILLGLSKGLIASHGLDHPYDKVVHIIFFTCFFFCMARLVRGKTTLGIVLAILAAIISEGVQGAFPGHQFSVLDIIANLSGCALGYGLLKLGRKPQTARRTQRSSFIRS